MDVTKRQVFLNRAIAVVTAILLISVAMPANAIDKPGAHAARYVSGRTIVSEESPKARLTIPSGFRFIGDQRIDLYGNSEAEQYVFVRSGTSNTVESFYLLQFEHFLPTNKLSYKYDAMQPMQIGDLSFIDDVKAFSDLASLLAEDQASDGAALERLLAKQNLALPHKCALVRIVHLPSTDHRTELLILYGEALPFQTEVPAGKDGVRLDTETRGFGTTFLEHASKELAIRRR